MCWKNCKETFKLLCLVYKCFSLKKYLHKNCVNYSNVKNLSELGTQVTTKLTSHTEMDVAAFTMNRAALRC